MALFVCLFSHHVAGSNSVFSCLRLLNAGVIGESQHTWLGTFQVVFELMLLANDNSLHQHTWLHFLRSGLKSYRPIPSLHDTGIELKALCMLCKHSTNGAKYSALNEMAWLAKMTWQVRICAA